MKFVKKIFFAVGFIAVIFLSAEPFHAFASALSTYIASDPLLSGSDGALVVNATTTNITASTKHYSSVSITNGGILNITGDGSMMIIGSEGNFTIDSTSKIQYLGVATTTTNETGASTIAPDGTVLYYNDSYLSGVNGGGGGGGIMCGTNSGEIDPGNAASIAPGQCGGLPFDGNGGGGASTVSNGGDANDLVAGSGADADAGVGDNIGGAGGTVASTNGVSAGNVSNSTPYYTDGPGGGGGHRGANGGGVYIKVGGTISIQGSIDVSGSPGGNGGNGGDATDGPGAFGGGGGGGGDGGSGGYVKLVYASGSVDVSDLTSSGPVIANNGVGGAGGNGGIARGPGGVDLGSAGNNPSYVNGDPGESGVSDGAVGNADAFDFVTSAPENATTSAISASSITWTWTSGGGGADSYFASTSNPNNNSGWISGTSWTDTSLAANTQYQLSVIAENDDLTQTVATTTTAYTAAPAPAGFSGTGDSKTSIAVLTNSFANDSVGLSGYDFSDSNGDTSGWVQAHAWEDANLVCGTSYTIFLKQRNTLGVQTATSSVSASTMACVTAQASAPAVVYSDQGGGSVSSAALASILAPSAAATAYIDSFKSTAAVSTVPSSPISSGSAPVFYSNFGLGYSGEAIKDLQQYLNANGYDVALSGPGSPGKETWFFGPLTKKALIGFQASHGIPATGFFGPITMKYINTH